VVLHVHEPIHLREDWSGLREYKNLQDFDRSFGAVLHQLRPALKMLDPYREQLDADPPI
jgi:hypothetical protein